MRQTNQLFVKGLNERIPKDRQTPDRLNKLQNARLDKRGETLFAVRIEGAEEWHGIEDGEYALALDQSAVTGDHDLTGYQKGYLIRLSHGVVIGELFPKQFGDLLVEDLIIDDIFKVSVRPVAKYSESVGLRETFVAKTLPVLQFIDGVQIADFIIIPTRFTLSFTDAVDVVDRDLSCLE